MSYCHLQCTTGAKQCIDMSLKEKDNLHQLEPMLVYAGELSQLRDS